MFAGIGRFLLRASVTEHWGIDSPLGAFLAQGALALNVCFKLRQAGESSQIYSFPMLWIEDSAQLADLLQVHSAVCIFKWQIAAAGPATPGAPQHAQPTPAAPRPTRPSGCAPLQGCAGGGVSRQ